MACQVGGGVSSCLHITVNEPLVSSNRKFGGPQSRSGPFGGREKHFAATRIGTPGRPARSLGTVPTMLFCHLSFQHVTICLRLNRSSEITVSEQTKERGSFLL